MICLQKLLRLIWKLVFLVSMFEGVTFVLGLEILVSFCIFMILNDLLICDEKIKSVVHDMKIGLFQVDLNSQIDPGTLIFGQTLHFSDLQQNTNWCQNNVGLRFMTQNKSFFSVGLWSLQDVGTLGNLTDLQVIIKLLESWQQ